MAVWIALGGIIGVIANIRQTQKRITIQENQQEENKKQFNTQIKNQNDQIQIQQKQLLDTRFSSGIELLGHTNESTRIGGVYNLYSLANEYGDDYLEPVCEILCAHIRTITGNKEYQEKYKEKPSNEIIIILTMLFSKDKNDKLIFDECEKNLMEIFLCGRKFYGATLNRVNLRSSILDNVTLGKTNLSRVSFRDASLTQFKFWKTKLHDSEFNGTKFNKVEFDETELKEVSFKNAQLKSIDFNKSVLENIDFTGTILQGYKNHEIIGNSLT
jgi:hypothetical protein